MPTFREDLHLGHKVATIDTYDIVDGAITEEKMADDSVSTRALQDKSVTEPKLDDGAVSTRTIQDKAVTEPKLDDGSVSHRTIQDDAVEGNNIKPGSIENRHLAPDAVETRNIKDGNVPARKLGNDVQGEIVLPITDSLDQKFTNITNELYSMIESLQVGGIALSQQFGDRTDIGISQKTLTKAFGRFWEEIERITHRTYMDFTLTVVPSSAIAEGDARVTVKADCSDAISDFDNIKLYVNNSLIAESSDITVFTRDAVISDTSVVKAVGTILGKEVTKTQTVDKLFPFFMGGGMTYQDVLVPACQKQLVGTLEGEYDATISTTGQYLFVIIPISRKEEFRRCKMDMNGFEIPFDIAESTDYVICKSKNVYQAGTYNIDININS